MERRRILPDLSQPASDTGWIDGYLAIQRACEGKGKLPPVKPEVVPFVKMREGHKTPARGSVINKRNGRFKVWSPQYLNAGKRGMSPT